MKNKFLSSILAVLMVLSCFTAMSVSVAAVELPANIGTDFTPVPLAQRTDNAISDPTGWGQNYYDITGFAETTSQNTYTIAAKAVDNYTDDSVGAWAAAGLIFSKSKIDTSIYAPGATLVFSASVISHNTNNPKLTWGIRQENYKSILPMEYPTRTAGFETSSTRWSTFGATVAIPITCDTLENTAFNFGFSSHDAPATSNYAVNINRSSMYLAVEAASDIKVTSDKPSVMAGDGSVINVDADIFNQVGSKGNLSQNVTWYVTNAERTEAIPGCSIVNGADGSAQITLPATITRGEYCIVAVSNVNRDLVKGVTLNVASYDDYVPGDANEGNVLTAETQYSMTYHPQFDEYDDYMTLSHGVNVNASGRPAQGFSIKSSTFDSSIFAPGNVVVFKANIKATKGAPRFNWGLMTSDNVPYWPLEYNGSGLGELITETEGYQEYTSTLVVPDDYVYYQANFGMPNTPEGETETTRAMEILKEGMYLGLERMYDIKVSADTTEWIPGETEKITVDADILNQFSKVSQTLNQDVSWLVFHEGRTTLASGFTVNPLEGDKSKAEIVVDEFAVEPGKYEIVAISDEDTMFVKGITIEVKAADSHIAKIERVDSAAGTFKAMAKLMDCNDDEKDINAVMCLVMMDDSGKLNDYEFTAVTDTYDSGKVTDTKYCEITLTNDTDKVLVFLLDCGEVTTPTIFDATVRELTRMKEFSIN